MQTILQLNGNAIKKNLYNLFDWAWRFALVVPFFLILYFS